MTSPSGASAPSTPTERYRAERAVLVGRPDLRGAALAAALAELTDRWLAALWDAAVPGPASDAALVAVGGHGRGELAPGSDLDLVIVHRNRPDVARLADAVWYPIWDAGLRLDHSVRSLRDLGAAMDADLRVALGLLDARTVAGSPALGAEVRAACADKWAGRSRRWLPEVAAAVEARHAAAGDLAFLLEPDLKEVRGGLRDLHLLVALAPVTPVLADLVAEGRLAGPGAGLTDARVELHRATGRAGNRLALQDQDAVAAALGTDADRLMAGLAAAGRTVAWASDDAWRRVRRHLAGGARSGVRRGPARPGTRWVADPIEPGLVVRAGEITLAYGADPADDPTLALRAAAASAELDLPLARPVIDAMARSAPAPAGVWPDGLREALLRLLGAGRPAVAAWETLDQQGVIVRLLPEWAAVRSRPQRNAFHRYTVDRHLLETVAAATESSRRVSRPDLLLLGALLHDLGKGRPGDHTAAGVGLVADLGPRLGLPPGDVEVLSRLVQLHLLLPETATRRDLDDPATIANVAAAVGDRATLELLAALTEADGRATGPSAWGAWKAGLVATLVERVARRLAGAPPPAPPSPTPAQRRLLAAGEVAVHLDGTALTVVAPDRPGLLAAVAGTLALDGATVRRASTRSEDGMALLVLHVEASRDRLPTAERLRADLGAALEGTLPIAERLAERARRRPPRRPLAAGPAPTGVVVRVDHAASATATVVEVRAPDRPGTLWRTAGALTAAGVEITAAVLATLGAEVVDTFYVRHDGRPLVEGDPRVAAICEAVAGALGSD